MFNIFFAGVDRPTVALITPLLEELIPLFTQLGENVPVLFHPIEWSGRQCRATVKFDQDGLHISVEHNSLLSASDLAHELMHVLLDLEGYPTLHGSEISGDIASWLLDGEVDRRVGEAGLDPTTDSDRDFVKVSLADPNEISPEAILAFYIVWHTTFTRKVSERWKWRKQLIGIHPKIVKIGDAVARILNEPKAMRTATAANSTFSRAAELLRGLLPVGMVVHAGPEFIALRENHWPKRIAQFRSEATTLD